MKYTEGEWIVSGGSQIVSMPSQCKITNNVSGWNDKEAEANAKLIAAAPDMLKALQGVIHHNNGLKEDYKASPSLISQIESVIKKATI